MTNNTARPLLTIDEVAEQLAVSEAFVRRLVRARRIEIVKIGKFVRFESETVRAFVESVRR